MSPVLTALLVLAACVGVLLVFVIRAKGRRAGGGDGASSDDAGSAWLWSSATGDNSLSGNGDNNACDVSSDSGGGDSCGSDGGGD